jgi:hypothetical protein
VATARCLVKRKIDYFLGGNPVIRQTPQQLVIKPDERFFGLIPREVNDVIQQAARDASVFLIELAHPLECREKCYWLWIVVTKSRSGLDAIEDSPHGSIFSVINARL